jgi:hypothetical protein
MGWHRIDPETGKPLKGGESKLRNSKVKLLNAVPGVDSEEGAYYMGDSNWDMASGLPKEIGDLVGDYSKWTADDLRNLFLRKKTPPGLGAELASELNEVVDEFWSDIDSAYEDDWDRGALEPEKRWTCEMIIAQFKGDE